jgi:hypothetical protein
MFTHHCKLLLSPVATAAGLLLLCCCMLLGCVISAAWRHSTEAFCHGGGWRFKVPPTLLTSAFGNTWQQPEGFKLQLSVLKDGCCIAGGSQGIC